MGSDDGDLCRPETPANEPRPTGTRLRAMRVIPAADRAPRTKRGFVLRSVASHSCSAPHPTPALRVPPALTPSLQQPAKRGTKGSLDHFCH
ncbi:hypothetical protein FKM82_028584 [Ascaphus truei]